MRHRAPHRASGVHLVEVISILGHAEIQTTMRYVHSLPEGQRRAAAKVDDVLWGDK
jgi:integrase